MLNILQLGSTDWSQEVTIPEETMIWHHTSLAELSDYLKDLHDRKLAKLLASMSEEEIEKNPPRVSVRFSAVILSESLEEAALDVLEKAIDAHAVFWDEGVEIFNQTEKGFVRRKMARPLPEVAGGRQGLVDFFNRTLFPSQYGAKLKIPDIDVNPNFKGKVSYNGHVSVAFEGHFGEGFTPLFSYRYNLSTFPSALELWQEYIKDGDCAIEIEITAFRVGSVSDVHSVRRLSEEVMAEPYILDDTREEVGFYSVTIFAKGEGRLDFGPMHWRYSRQGLGRFVLGGGRFADRKRQEFIYYFNPQDMKPPLNVYFSGFRTAEGFEGYGIMKSLKGPFILVGDPRLEGGCFYSGTEEFEAKIEEVIQDALDYLGFDSSQLVLSGLSMGTFGALYYASRFNPHAVIIGKPLVNVGNSASNLKLKRPDEFETSADMLKNLVNGTDQEAIHALNQRFWSKFDQSDFPDTRFAIAYMEQDDYDGTAMPELIENLAHKNAHIYGKGYTGRHNDNSPSINKWFMRQFVDILTADFGRSY